jgi:pimeloyl-ACP methyl ester carboxylesterase
MAGPMTERRPVAPRDAPVGPTPPELLPEAVRRAVADMAGAHGAWCPALSPEGDRVAYVTDRSGIPRLELARLDGGTPLVLSGPTEEVVSGGSICAELHVVRPDGSGHRVIAGEDRRATVFVDVLATVDELVGGGIAIPGRIGAYGWSYGGLPDPGCADPVAGPVRGRRHACRHERPADLLRRDRTVDGSGVGHRVRRPGHRPGHACALSPMTGLGRLTSPVLLAHGDRDSNVPVAESVQAHQELQALGVPSDLLLLPGEGRTVVGRHHLVELSERVAAWFDRWL